jgi:hypothetical protein
MRFSCLLVVSLLGSLPVAALAAQPVDHPQADPNVTVAPALSSGTVVQFSNGSHHPITPPRLLDDKTMQELLAKAKTTANDALAKNDTQCYSIESYRFQRKSPDSDATRMTGRSDCTPASEFHLKTVAPKQRSGH